MDFPQYEPLFGHIPSRVLAVHPSSRYIALEAMVTLSPHSYPYSRRSAPIFERAGIWDTMTGSLLWCLPDVKLIMWTPDGMQVVFLKETFSLPLRYPRRQFLDFQSTYVLERLSWPGLSLLSQCELHSQFGGWPTMMSMSSLGNAIAVNFVVPQYGKAWEFVMLTEEGDFHLFHAGYINRIPSLLNQSPIFSPTGRYIVSGYHEERVWQRDHDGIPYEVQLVLHNFEVGRITIVDTVERYAWEIVVADVVPIGAFSQSVSRSPLPNPVFADEEHFVIELPAGHQRVYSLYA